MVSDAILGRLVDKNKKVQGVRMQNKVAPTLSIGQEAVFENFKDFLASDVFHLLTVQVQVKPPHIN